MRPCGHFVFIGLILGACTYILVGMSNTDGVAEQPLQQHDSGYSSIGQETKTPTWLSSCIHTIERHKEETRIRLSTWKDEADRGAREAPHWIDPWKETIRAWKEKNKAPSF
jgi:hypothetical protein